MIKSTFDASLEHLHSFKHQSHHGGAALCVFLQESAASSCRFYYPPGKADLRLGVRSKVTRRSGLAPPPQLCRAQSGEEVLQFRRVSAQTMFHAVCKMMGKAVTLARPGEVLKESRRTIYSKPPRHQIGAAVSHLKVASGYEKTNTWQWGFVNGSWSVMIILFTWKLLSLLLPGY